MEIAAASKASDRVKKDAEWLRVKQMHYRWFFFSIENMELAAALWLVLVALIGETGYRYHIEPHEKAADIGFHVKRQWVNHTMGR